MFGQKYRSFSLRAPKTRGSRRQSPQSSIKPQSTRQSPQQGLLINAERERERKVDSPSTYIFQDPHLAHDTLHLRIILALQFIQHRIAVLTLAIRRSRPEPSFAGVTVGYSEPCAVRVAAAAAASVAIAIASAGA